MIKKIIIYLLIIPLSVSILLTALLINSGEPLLSDASILLYLIVVFISIIPGAFMVISGPRVKLAIATITVFGFIYAMYFRESPSIWFIPFGEAGTAVVIFIIIYLIAWLLRERLGEILIVVYSVLLLSVILTPIIVGSDDFNASQKGLVITQENSNINNKLPRYIHIILDAHIGIEGMLVDTAERKDYVNALVSKYLDYDFDVFGRAYSIFYNTAYSMTSFFNYGLNEYPNNKMVDNKLFESLKGYNYQFNIYETDYIELCDYDKFVINKCSKYKTDIMFLKGEALGNKILIALNEIAIRYRLAMAWNLLSSTYLGKLLGISSWDWDIPEVDRYGSASLNILEQLKDDVMKSPGGEAFIAHLMLPHFPYIFDSDCEQTSLNGVSFDNNDYDGYLPQLQCVQKKIMKFISLLQENNMLDNSIVIIQSDHGSRLSEHNNSNYDTRDWHNILFVAHLPGDVEGKYYLQPVSASETLKHIHGDLFGDLELMENKVAPYVYLQQDEENSNFKKIPLIPFKGGVTVEHW